MSTPDIIGARIRVKVNATTLSGNRHPYAGRCGLVTGHRPGGTLELEIAGASLQLGRETVAFLAADELSHDLVPLPSDVPTAAPPLAAAPQTAPHVAPPGTEFAMLALNAIVRSRTNPRTHFDPAKLQELADSIAASGVHQPVLVRPLPANRLQDTLADRIPGEPLPTFELIAGERRYRASKLAGQSTIPVMVKAMSDAQVLEVQLVENLQREDLHPMEEAEGYERLIQETGMRKEDIGDVVKKSRSYVYARLNLLKLTTEARRAFYDDKIDASRALVISRIPDQALQEKALARATQTDYQGGVASFKEFQRWAQQNVMLRLDAARFTITQIDLVPQGGNCNECDRRTGAHPELFTDVDSADVCTDPKCYHAKEDAHDVIALEAAKASGKKIIAGKAAKEAWPSKHSDTLEGFVRVDKPDHRTGTKKSVKSLLGKDAPETMLLISPHSGEQVEVLPANTVSKILKDKGHLTPHMARQNRQLSEHEVVRKITQRYEAAWRTRAIEATWQAMQGSGEGVSDAFLRLLAKNLVSDLRQDERAHVAQLLGLGKVATHEGIRAHLDDTAICDGQRVHQVLQLLAMQLDMQDIVDYSTGGGKAAPYIDAAAADYGVDLVAIKEHVATEMKAEAAPKAEAPAAVPAKGKAAGKVAPRKTGKAEAAASIAEALAAADTAPGLNDFSVGDAVLIKINLRGPKGKVLNTAGLAATIENQGGDRAWLVRYGAKDADIATADYTELRHADGDAPPDTAKPTLKASAKGAPVKYQCPMTGSTWTGRGKQPTWVHVAIEGGKTLQDLEYQPGQENAGASPDDTGPAEHQTEGEAA